MIDYLECHYIEFFKGTEYVIENDGTRVKPTVEIYEKADIDKYIKQLDFLLLANDIIHQHQNDTIEPDYKKYNNSNYDSKLIRRDGNFILLKNNEINFPVEKSKNWETPHFMKHKRKK